MRRAVQRDLMSRRRDVRHKGQIFFVGVLRADKEGSRNLLLIENFQNWRVFLLGPSSKVRQTILGSAVSPVAADTAKQSLGVSVSAYSRWYSRWMMPDSSTNIAASTTPASNLAFRSSLSASRRMASPSPVVVWYRVCGHGGK